MTALAILPAQYQAETPSDVPSLGRIVDVTCASDASESYALYLPSTYTPARNWPIIYFFDPGGDGKRPLELYKGIAETYGFIFAGSNNSRNFSTDQPRVLKALWDDTHQRLSLDEHRTYTSGFSGGARVAGMMALSCVTCQIVGVIAHGAGYPSSNTESKDRLLYFLAVGDRDFNWPEVVTIRRERERNGQPYRVRVFSGQHQWAPPAVMEEAVQWFALRAMEADVAPRNAAFIDRMFQLAQNEVHDAEKERDALAELSAYRSLVSDFAGLRDVTGFASSVAVLKESRALKAAWKSEQEQITEQLALEDAIAPKLQAYLAGSPPDLNGARMEILQTMRGLRDQAAHSKDEAKRLIASRTFDGLWVREIESGQQELEALHFDKAEVCFELMSQIGNDPWPLLLLAETHATAGNRKQAIKDLRKAVGRGLKDADVIDSNQRLQVLKSDPEFQQLVAELKRK